MSASYVCEHPDCQAEGTEAMPGGERYCAKHAPEPLPNSIRGWSKAMSVNVPVWAWGEDRFSSPYGIDGVARAIAESIVCDLDNDGCALVMAPDGTEYQVNVTVTLTPVFVNADEAQPEREPETLCHVCAVKHHDTCANNPNCPCCCETIARMNGGAP